MRINYILLILLICTSCAKKKEQLPIKKEDAKTTISKHKNFNEYWYDGFAEITSYKLLQSRYGEVHEGTAVTIFVTEPFLPEKQVKADYQNESNIPVLKLNKTKKFVTGIYPYSLMTSTFSPLGKMQNAIKISFSSQEWCGNTFAQLNNRENFEIDFRSYFETNADKKITLQKEILENELWNLLRISPENLPIGQHKIIPSFEYLSLNHKELKAYNANCELLKEDDTSIYVLKFPELNRTLKISFENTFPFYINQWEEIVVKNNQELVTKATKIKQIKSKYWSKNSPKDKDLRLELNL